ncbi:anaerobic ribonucleoside-triphosphate reductase activating protein [Treponema pectinovorum]|uniref:anaerobic ribonucleoside-triphosphate reductase activating protein n=1 Tax=Treponema pectinovorum TaxID=164 RepID=UPI003D91D724
MSEKIGALVRTSLVDFPGKVCATIFFKNCNLRCPYCYNLSLVKGEDEEDFVTIEELKSHLEKRKNVLDALVISGGEALLNKNTPYIIAFAKNLGYKVKLDTNGTFPEKLEQLLKDEQTEPDFIAMDIKTSPQNYAKFLLPHIQDEKNEIEEKLIKSVKILSNLPPEKREFRTVLVPTLIKKQDIENIASILPKDASWQFARFINDNCLEPLYNSLPPYSEKESEDLVSFAKTMILGANLR